MAFSIPRLSAFVAVATVVLQTPALAHHVMGGQMPQTFMQGLLSGLGHPVIGLDHFAAILGIGILAGIAGRGIVPVLAFSAAVIAGVAVHLGKVDLPSGELLVGLTTLAIGALVLLRQTIRPGLAAALFAIAGLVHGYALGESIVGAEPTPIVAYLAGLFVIQTVIGTTAYAVTLQLGKWPARAMALSTVGVLVVLVGGVAAASATGLMG